MEQIKVQDFNYPNVIRHETQTPSQFNTDDARDIVSNLEMF